MQNRLATGLRRLFGAATITSAFAAVFLLAPAPAFASHDVYDYRVEGSHVGDIGAFINVVNRKGDNTEVESQLRVAAKFLGITFFDENANRVERWHNGRFIYFRGTTDTNGTLLNISGHAASGAFVIVTPHGKIVAPRGVHPSNPWSPLVLKSNVLMSTRTGKVTHVRVIDTGEVEATFDGKTRRLHRFFVDGNKHQVVWFDGKGVPIAFETPEHGMDITFILMHSDVPRG